MYNQAAQAYQATSKLGESPRELEAQLLLKAALRLQLIADNWDEQSAQLNDAVTYNRRLWTFLVTAATGADSQLPDALKGNIVNLANFIFRRSVNVLAHPEPERIKVLIDINRNIAEGLRGNA